MKIIRDPAGFSNFLRLILLVIAFSLNGQDAVKPVFVEITTQDDTILKGQLLGVKNDTVAFRNQYDEALRIPMKSIRSIEYSSSLRRRKSWPESPNSVRYLFAPTAYPLKEEEILYQNTYLFLNSVQMGVSESVTLGAGMDVFGARTYFLTTKVNVFNRVRYKFSAGATYFHLPNDAIETTSGDDIRDIGIVYGAGTWGNTNHHFTVGAGYLVVKSYFLPPIVSISGTTRLARNFALVTENWFFFVGEHLNIPAIISGGVRYIGRKSTLDLAFYTDHTFSGDVALPYISYSVRLGE